MTEARVVGAGISGLIAAWCLSDAGYDVTLTDADSAPGGLVRSMTTPEGLVEQGPNALRWTPATMRWFERLGLQTVFPHKAHRRRFVFRNGRARRWPLLPTETLAMGGRLGLAAATRALLPREGEMVKDFIDRIAGRAASTWLVGPMLQGIYAAPPERLSAAAVFGGRMRRRNLIATPRVGMGQFVDRLAAGLRAKGVHVEMSRRVERVKIGVPTVVCTDARSAAALLVEHAPAVATALERIRMSDAASVTCFFEPHAHDLDGFGVLFPGAENFNALGVVFNTSLFADRGPHRSETWIFGAKAHALDDSMLVDTVLRERRRLTGRHGTLLAAYATRRRAALPIYDQNLFGLRDVLPCLPPWLTLAGNYLGRIGLADLIERAEAAAARLVARASVPSCST